MGRIQFVAGQSRNAPAFGQVLIILTGSILADGLNGCVLIRWAGQTWT